MLDNFIKKKKCTFSAKCFNSCQGSIFFCKWSSSHGRNSGDLLDSHLEQLLYQKVKEPWKKSSYIRAKKILSAIIIAFCTIHIFSKEVIQVLVQKHFKESFLNLSL